MTGDRTLSPRGLESLLRERLAAQGDPSVTVRVVRFDGLRALVEIPHTAVPAARAAWNGAWTDVDDRPVTLTTRATWGTLVKGKAWLRAPVSG